MSIILPKKKKRKLSHTNSFPSFHKIIFQITSINLNLLKYSGYIFIQSFSFFLGKINKHPSGILKQKKHEYGRIVLGRKFRIYEYINWSLYKYQYGNFIFPRINFKCFTNRNGHRIIWIINKYWKTNIYFWTVELPKLQYVL